jgi:hypothetical protein
MDQAILRRTNARHLPEVEKINVRGFSDRQLRMVQKEGGFGDYKDANGKWTKSVRAYYDPDAKKKKVAIYKPPERGGKKKMTQEQKEYQEFLEDLMERESAGKHDLVKPNRERHKKKQLDNWVEGDRPVQGVDV